MKIRIKLTVMGNILMFRLFKALKSLNSDIKSNSNFKTNENRVRIVWN